MQFLVVSTNRCFRPDARPVSSVKAESDNLHLTAWNLPLTGMFASTRVIQAHEGTRMTARLSHIMYFMLPKVNADHLKLFHYSDLCV